MSAQLVNSVSDKIKLIVQLAIIVLKALIKNLSVNLGLIKIRLVRLLVRFVMQGAIAIGMILITILIP